MPTIAMSSKKDNVSRHTNVAHRLLHTDCCTHIQQRTTHLPPPCLPVLVAHPPYTIVPSPCGRPCLSCSPVYTSLCQCARINKIEKSVSIDHTRNCIDTYNQNIKIYPRITSTFQVIRACMCIYVVGTGSYTTSTTNMYHKDFTYAKITARMSV